MSIAHLLEDFEINLMDPALVRLIDEDGLEEIRLTAFEEGYSAGWDDAVQARTEDNGRITAALARNLEDLSFTYNEALTQMSLSLEPMFASLMSTVLPGTMDKSFTHHIVEQLKSMAQDQVAQPALLIVPSGVGAVLKPVLDQEFSFPVQLVEEASLPDGQACLRIGTQERDVDCSSILTSISEAMESFLYQAKEVS
ncbi:ABC transporter ATP-binding protein [Ruegeria aquimaris]|uniref:ABC transporter ATP-binding protein n=1 Tax=Ruegeria aquimaris TaxID=2984333 RepID=A0ABT3AFM8_9RHOB|nr:ABC transporter ATP-binding protein [Ruegeria sp. XHP0148]MCV2887483.1 ABC transporter ATP-binding protein [Ruegeria sp. XHP0148]